MSVPATPRSTVPCKTFQRCVQHVIQRIDLTVTEISLLLGGLDISSPQAWHNFKTDFRQAFSKPSDHVGLQFADIFKLRPDSLSTEHLTAFYADVRRAVNDLLRDFGDIPRFSPIYTALQDNQHLFKAFIAESVLYSTLPRKLVEAVDHNYSPPESESQIPSSFALACNGVPVVSDPGSVVTHANRVSFPQEYIPRERADSPANSGDRRPTGSPHRFTSRPTYSRAACSPARPPRHHATLPPYGCHNQTPVTVVFGSATELAIAVADPFAHSTSSKVTDGKIAARSLTKSVKPKMPSIACQLDRNTQRPLIF